jgi:hypothetical protein
LVCSPALVAVAAVLDTARRRRRGFKSRPIRSIVFVIFKVKRVVVVVVVVPSININVVQLNVRHSMKKKYEFEI